MPRSGLCALEPRAWYQASCETLIEAPTIFSPLWLVSTVVKIDSFQSSPSLLLQTTVVKVAGIAFELLGNFVRSLELLSSLFLPINYFPRRQKGILHWGCSVHHV